MPTFRWTAGLVLAAMLAAAKSADAQKVTFLDPVAAYEQGLGALKAERYDLAIPALEFAAANEVFLAEYYLARLYADNARPYANHAKAYALFQRISDRHADAEPGDDWRTPFIAKTMTALASYLGRGLPEIGLKPNPAQAGKYLLHAATIFNDEDAQFELARHYLAGEPSAEDVKRAMHWLSVLTRKWHSPAQAFLADIYWRGKFVERDPARALALIMLAVETAPQHERIWIEDIYHKIFCGASPDVRRQAEATAAVWRRQHDRGNQDADPSQAAGGGEGAERKCSNGERIRLRGKADTTAEVTGSVDAPAADKGR